MYKKMINCSFSHKRNVYGNLKAINNYSINQKNLPKIIEPNLLNDNFKQLYDKYKDKIYYSSLFENNLERFSYKKKKIIENVLKNYKIQKSNLDASAKPFPISLKYLNSEIDQKLQNELDDDYSSKELKLISTKMKDNLNKIKNFENELAENKYEKRYEQHWLQDYECFDETEINCDSEYGTPDLSVPVSKIPCGGCGAFLHCADTSIPGYLPREIFKGRKDYELKNLVCQRCHFLKTYNIALNVRVTPEDYINIISTIQDKMGLAILIIDLLDFPCSIWPGIINILGSKRPVFLVGNKVDLLPKDSKNYLNHIKECLIQAAVEKGFDAVNVKHVSLISATTGYGIEELITQIHNKWGTRGDVYLIGCTNVGKSSLFNALLQSDMCKTKASSLIQKATASPWPGTTLRLLKFPILRPSDMRLYYRTQRIILERVKRASEAKLRKAQANKTGSPKYATLIGHIGRTFVDNPEEHSDPFLGIGQKPILTFNEEDAEYKESRWCYDTPGVMHPEQILHLLTTEEILQVVPKDLLRPRSFLLKPNMSLFLAGLGRLDYLNGESSILLTVYSSPYLPILICSTNFAEDIYEKFIGTEILGIPMGDQNRLATWPGLKSGEKITINGEGKKHSTCDMVLSSAGWISLTLPQVEHSFKCWSPNGRGIFLRKPSLLPFGGKLKGDLIRGSLAYRDGKTFVKQ